MARIRLRWLGIALAVLAAAAALELAARALVAVRPDVVPAPPPVGLGRNLDASGLAALLHPDPDLLFALDPGVDADFPRANAYDQSFERFRVHLNERGYRTPPFTDAKPDGVTRIVCIGDAVTFGAYVEDEAAYPRQLAARLEEAAPGRFEVINLGVPGYTSRQGLELLRRQVLALHPDVVVFAFGHADRALRAAATDDERLQASAARGPLARLVERSALLRVLGAVIGQEPAAPARAPLADDVQRGSLDDIAAAIVAAQAAVQAAGGRLLVINADFGGTDAVEGIRRGVEQSHAEYVDAAGAVRAVARQRNLGLAMQHQLPPPQPPEGEMAFRVEAPDHPEVWLELLRGGESALVPMHDDGSGGDQVAGDGVYTVLIPGSRGEIIPFTYRGGSVLGPVREFNHGGQRNPSLRQTAFQPARNEIDRFGVVPLMAAPNLPDAEGHGVMAQALAAYLLAPPAPAAHAAATPAAAATPGAS
jgi:lysophospholipase L1-like esterase